MFSGGSKGNMGRKELIQLPEVLVVGRTNFDYVNLINPFQPSIAFHKETSHLFCMAKQIYKLTNVLLARD